MGGKMSRSAKLAAALHAEDEVQEEQSEVTPIGGGVFPDMYDPTPSEKPNFKKFMMPTTVDPDEAQADELQDFDDEMDDEDVSYGVPSPPPAARAQNSSPLWHTPTAVSSPSIQRAAAASYASPSVGHQYSTATPSRQWQSQNAEYATNSSIRQQDPNASTPSAGFDNSRFRSVNPYGDRTKGNGAGSSIKYRANNQADDRAVLNNTDENLMEDILLVEDIA
jgi:hypothetical protein